MIRIQTQPIDVDALLTAVADDDCGASVLFTGQTRRWTGETETSSLFYEAFEKMAIAQLEELAAAAKRRFPIKQVAIVHRVGEVEVGELSVALAVGSPHRDAAFAAAAWLMDELKRDVAIWKREHSPAGDRQWVHPQLDADAAIDGGSS